MGQESTVAIVRCNEYAHDAVLGAVRRGVEMLGGPKRFVRANEHILLKPNMLVPDLPERCVTTHPSMLRAVGQVFGEAGARVSFGDSPAVSKPATVARKSGFAEAVAALGMPMADFTTGCTMSFTGGVQNKQFRVVEAVRDADGLINLPKLKTHGLTRMTGAVKNLFGCVPGLLKAEYHLRLPEPDRFSQMLVDLAAMLRPRLHIMDGIVAMEGNGPRGGTPKRVGVLLFSIDPVALDATASRIIGLTPEYAPTTKYGAATGLGVAHADRIEIVGEPIESVAVAGFELVNRPPLALPQRGLMRLLRDRIVPRPVILIDKCTHCGQCIAVCPTDPKSVDWLSGDHKRPPVHDYKTCIRCYCCQELCPESAIVIKTPWLGRLLPR